MQMATLKKVGKRLLQFGLPLLVLVVFVYYVRRDWDKLTAYTFRWDPWLLLVAFLGFLLQEISFGFIWRAILARLGSQLDLRTSLRIYLASEFVRYIPGNVWHVLTRVLWAGKRGVPRPVAFASMVVELITKLAAGVLIFALSLLFWPDIGTVSNLLHGTPIVMGLGVITIFALVVILHPRVLGGLLNFALRILKREPVLLTLRYSDILLITLAWMASWFVAGCGFYMMLLALWPGVPLLALPICIGIYAMAWDVGFVSFITPGGLGFREGAIVGLFALALPIVPVSLATILAILSRFVSTIAELVCVGIAYMGGGRQMREVQQEQAKQPSSSLSSSTVENSSTDIPITETPEQVGIEGGIGND
ncbi:flippase-like domain-containing protein [Ktedonosporobacter rubrisoli]|uniref:Flippase-like domain-containing protein n=1 Tax=Ktedonosporobacter rubrisoli TaxID=2509675 RepID=A0A4P6K337_KTERU|nr:lysylphosphatidylglycerol synthase transmembrane domain-containing protein [Ktedonosporobacter rubrisoli]QBD82352.1 flippase-like domain-containing protein [Ktedonosporobacter rubrisoli]